MKKVNLIVVALIVWVTINGQVLMDVSTIPLPGVVINNIYPNNNGWIVTGYQDHFGTVVFVDSDAQVINQVTAALDSSMTVSGVVDNDNNWYFLFPKTINNVVITCVIKCTSAGDILWFQEINGNMCGGVVQEDYIYFCGTTNQNQRSLYLLKHDSALIIPWTVMPEDCGQYTNIYNISDSVFCAYGQCGGLAIAECFIRTNDDIAMLSHATMFGYTNAIATCSARHQNGMLLSGTVNNCTFLWVLSNGNMGMTRTYVLPAWSQCQSLHVIDDSLFAATMNNNVINICNFNRIPEVSSTIQLFVDFPYMLLGNGINNIQSSGNNIWCGMSDGSDVVIARYQLQPVHVDDWYLKVSDPHMLVAYPQPCNNLVNIQCVIKFNTPSEFSVYDIRGRKIYNRLSSASNILWDTRDNNGRCVSSGVYICRYNNYTTKLSITR